jgi:hypothetical protein
VKTNRRNNHGDNLSGVNLTTALMEKDKLTLKFVEVT